MKTSRLITLALCVLIILAVAAGVWVSRSFDRAVEVRRPVVVSATNANGPTGYFPDQFDEAKTPIEPAQVEAF